MKNIILTAKELDIINSGLHLWINDRSGLQTRNHGFATVEELEAIVEKL